MKVEINRETLAQLVVGTGLIMRAVGVMTEQVQTEREKQAKPSLPKRKRKGK
jgi:hypothetical protein